MTNKNTSWSGVAEWYDELLEENDDSFQKNVVLPNLLRIVDPKQGMNVLDVACGQGYFCRAFHEKGAMVVGCDISKELIALAKKNSAKEIEYFVAPADSFLSEVAPQRGATSDFLGRFDIATIVLALQNIDNVAGTLSECAKALKSGGRLIFVLNHPAFRIPKSSSWQFDEANAVQYRRIDSYMSDSQVKIDMTPGEKNESKKKNTVSFHRPLQSYFKALNKSGFAVTRLEEWISHKKSQAGPRGKEEDRMRKEIPMFLCVEAKRTA